MEHVSKLGDRECKEFTMLGKSYQKRPLSRIEARLLLPFDQEPGTE